MGERGGGGCHIQIPESTLVEKVTVWVKGVGWLSHTDTRKYTGGEGHCVGERGRGGCHIQIPEGTLVEKVTVWMKGVGVAVTYRYQKVHWWRRSLWVKGVGVAVTYRYQKVHWCRRSLCG